MKFYLRPIVFILLLNGLTVPSFTLGGETISSVPSGSGSYKDLKQLFSEFLDWRSNSSSGVGQITTNTSGELIETVSNHDATVLAKRRDRLGEMQSRLSDMNVSAWNRAEQIDYLAIRSRLDQQEFLLNVSRPWARDPGYYVDRMLRVTFTEIPVGGEALVRLHKQLRAIPVLASEAKKHLDDVAADYADLAIYNLSNADGVGHGHPYRSEPPAGVLGWYQDVLERASSHQPELVSEITTARDAVVEFQRWLLEQRSGWTAQAGSGRAAFNWYLKNVKLMPWSADDLVLLGQQELDRLWSTYALEQQRNRLLPELNPAGDAQEYQSRIDATDAHIRRFLEENSIITVPVDIGVLATNAPWIVRPGGRNFWEEIQFRDPHPDHLHAVIPGHRFDGIMASRIQDPVRSKLYSAARTEGWATYLEEAMLEAGMFEDMPRVRELIYIFGIFRAARVPADVWLQTRQMSVNQVVEFWLPRVPYLDKNVARVDAEIYLRRPPGYGIGYTVGALQMRRLLADRKMQLGDEFDLQEFHDYIMSAGRLPLSLLRWELTGNDDEVRHFWQHEPLPVPSRN